MATQVVSRDVETQAVGEFLASVTAGPSALIVEGEAGIGKTTVWLAAVERAHERGFRVLSTRATSAESVAAYSSLADLLDEIHDDVFAGLAPPQRIAMDRVLLRVRDDGPVTDQRAVAAAFLSVVKRLAEGSAVLVAIDDLQWLDPPSAQVISSAVRRLSGAVGVLATLRTGAGADGPKVALELREPNRLRRFRVPPLSVGALHKLLFHRLGQSFSRPKMLQIHEVSGGNPFYALELARAMEDGSTDAVTSLPGTLAGLVRSRIGRLTADARRALLAAACVPDPSVGLIARAIETDIEHVVAILEEAEDKGIIEIDGQHIGFAHPLLVRGVYGEATPARRREMHRRLAEIVDDPELTARHLALAATTGDQLTLDSLDTAAELARVRGAPIAAAELLEFAMRLGGDTPDRQIRAAVHHFNAGEAARARALLNNIIERPAPKSLRAAALRLLGLWSLLDGSSREAADLLNKALNDAGDDPVLRVQILVPLAYVRFNVGRRDDAANCIADAVRTAERIGQPQLLSEALAMHALVSFYLGDGLDEPALARALELEDREAPMSALLAATVQSAVLMGGSGQLDKARDELLAIRRRGIERGDEIELLMFALHAGLNGIWRGNFAECALIAEDVTERAVQFGGDIPLAVAPMLQSALAAYAGQELEARRHASEALKICEQSDSPFLITVWPITALGFLEVSLGNYKAALDTLEPWLRVVDAAPNGTEILVAPFLPDAIEAMIHLGRLDEAERFVELLEANGSRLDRPWMLAVGTRCRGMLLAATGDVEAASAAAERALAEHQRLPMPFELARTQLLMGQLQRREKQREAASATLRVALATFEELGTPLWAERARAELERASGVRTRAELTATEQRVAELAASGVTNREMAAALFISPKTVEANLSRVYRKLNIRSRAELGRIMARAEA
ncbi:ATP-binding protein [Mycobacterium sp.]|uniref:ATP-binding protein n=1 Tax=Mycobacterium sp. TaxID=1785 RepID=UPI002D8298CA|nr:AAA family ATPase [Mycobacterium sp.]